MLTGHKSVCEWQAPFKTLSWFQLMKAEAKTGGYRQGAELAALRGVRPLGPWPTAHPAPEAQEALSPGFWSLPCPAPHG